MATRSDHFAVAGTFSLQGTVPAVAAATATTEYPLVRIPESVGENGVEIQEINAIFQAGINGNDNNRRNINIDVHDGKAGTPGVEIANHDFTAGVDVTALAVLKIFSGKKDVDEGSIITLESEKIGNGQNHPQVLIEVVFRTK